VQITTSAVVGFFACCNFASLALTMAKEKNPKWNKVDDKKLAEPPLWQNGSCCQLKDLSKESTHKVIENFYPERNYNPLFRTKAQAYNLGQSLASA
jgi:hypothetical protein